MYRHHMDRHFSTICGWTWRLSWHQPGPHCSLRVLLDLPSSSHLLGVISILPLVKLWHCCQHQPALVWNWCLFPDSSNQNLKVNYYICSGFIPSSNKTMNWSVLLSVLLTYFHDFSISSAGSFNWDTTGSTGAGRCLPGVAAALSVFDPKSSGYPLPLQVWLKNSLFVSLQNNGSFLSLLWRNKRFFKRMSSVKQAGICAGSTVTCWTSRVCWHPDGATALIQHWAMVTFSQYQFSSFFLSKTAWVLFIFKNNETFAPTLQLIKMCILPFSCRIMYFLAAPGLLHKVTKTKWKRKISEATVKEIHCR